MKEHPRSEKGTCDSSTREQLWHCEHSEKEESSWAPDHGPIALDYSKLKKDFSPLPALTNHKTPLTTPLRES